MAYSLQGLNNYISSEVSKVYWLNKIYPPEIRKAHTDGDFHIHDLGILSVYCVGWDLEDLLLRGLPGRRRQGGKPARRSTSGAPSGRSSTSSTPCRARRPARRPSRTSTRCSRRSSATTSLDYDGGEAGAAGVRLQHQRARPGWASRRPFTNVTLDLHVPSSYAATSPSSSAAAASDGDLRRVPGRDEPFQPRLPRGDGRGRRQGPGLHLPHPHLQHHAATSTGTTPSWTGSGRVTAKYGIPYFSNFVNSDMSPEDARSMCCRLRLDTAQPVERGRRPLRRQPAHGLDRRGHHQHAAPRATSAEPRRSSSSRLGELMELAKDEPRDQAQGAGEVHRERNALPLHEVLPARRRESASASYWKNHFSTIGLVGMNEAC